MTNRGRSGYDRGMRGSELDHITVIAGDLDAGVEHVWRVLGVAPEGGGDHPTMGTHNRLLKLGERTYLEVIAVNPAAARPARPRWFGLDDLSPGAPPRLGVWAARTGDIRAALAACAEPLGAAEPMTRAHIRWLISIPADGRPPLDGAAPALIEWPAGIHPATQLRDAGLRLTGLEIVHPAPGRVEAVLRALAFDGDVRVTRGARPRLVADIDTPSGRVRLA